MLGEKQFKDAVLRHLTGEGALDACSVLISELNIDHFQRRADLVLANGRLSAFEIKSERDSLDRLPGQMEVYCRNFESVTVVSSPKFTKKVRQLVPPHVGLWEVSQSDGEVPQVHIIRQGKFRRISIETALAFLTVDDLKRLISKESLRRPEKPWRPLLLDAVRTLPAERLRAEARAALKRRYRHRCYASRSSSPEDAVLSEELDISAPSKTRLSNVTPRATRNHS